MISSEFATRLINATEAMGGTNENGSEVIADTNLHDGSWSSIVMITATSFTTLTGNHSGWSGVSYPAGFVLNGVFSQIQLASGSIVAYKR